MAGNANEWTTTAARTRLGEVIGRALAEGPQTITRRGRTMAVVVSAEEWGRRTTPKGNLADFFASSPLRGVDLDLERLPDEPRDVDL